MSAMVLMGLLGFSLLLPIFVNDDVADDTADPANPVDPTEPAEPADPDAPDGPDTPTEPGPVVDGTDGPDALIASDNEQVNAGAGDDTITFDAGSDGAIANGEAGDDSLIADGTTPTLNGGDGADVLSTGGAEDAVLNGDDGNDTLSADGSGGTTANGGLGNDSLFSLVDSMDVVLNGDEGADIIAVDGLGNTGNGGLGQDVLTANGQNTIDGGEGDDTLTALLSNIGDPDLPAGSVLLGGGGDDLLSESTDIAVNVAINADGGAGNDTIEAGAQLFDTLGPDDEIDTLTGGDGNDTFTVDVLSDLVESPTSSGLAPDLITAVQITDFNSTDDALVIQTTNIDRFETDPMDVVWEGFSLTEDPDGGFTDVLLTYTEAGSTTQNTITVRLLDVTGLTPADITLVT